MEVRRKDALARAEAQERYEAEIAAEEEVRRKDAVARAEAQKRYEEEIEAELRRREEEELRRKPSRLQNVQNSRQASRGRLQERTSLHSC